MIRLPRVINGNTLKTCIRPSFAQARQYSIKNKQIFTAPTKKIFEKQSFGASKIITLAAFSSATTPLLFKNSVQCEAAYAPEITSLYEHKVPSKPLLNKGELTFGTFLGICTGFLIKKVGKIFAAFVGTGFVFLQYLAQQGYVTIHWDRMESGYKKTLDIDKDGKVSTRDLQTKWQKFVNILTNNIQFKSTFLVGFYAGMRYG